VDPLRVPLPDLRSRRIVIGAAGDGTVVSAVCCESASFGGNDVLVVGSSDGAGAYRSYLAFDLDEIREVEVVAAELRLSTVRRWCAGESPLVILVHAARQGWLPESLTWLSQPGATGQPLGHAVTRPAWSRETVIDVTRLVAGWSTGAIANHGLVVRARTERRGERVAWYSAEATDPRLRPMLEVYVR
jgi:hypothetical protein